MFRAADDQTEPGFASETASGDPRAIALASRRSKVRPGLVQIFPRPADEPGVWPVPKSALLGRQKGADILISDALLSRRHATAERTAGGFRVVDLGSRHGTFVDGRPAGQEGLDAPYGAVVRVGRTLLLVVEDIVRYEGPPHRIDAKFLGSRRDVFAGPALWEVWQQATRVSSLAHPVLILGESGSGKEAVARLLHATRSAPGPFVALNLAAVPEGLFESELFGHVRGAFTGAHTSHPGAFREAQNGVLFLDEIGDLRLDLQAKLLRCIDQMRVRPLGARDDEPVNVRVVAATSIDLAGACTQGTFRTDLYYRLSGIVIRVPPLRERPDEIVMLADAMLRASHAELGLSVAAAEALALAPWPGNVRELDNVITQATVSAFTAGSAQVGLEHLPELESRGVAPGAALTAEDIVAAFRRTDGNASLAADALGISRAQLYKLFKRHGIDPAALRAER